MKRLLQILLCLVTALELCGGHLGVAQMVAWTKMIRDCSAEKGLFTGVKETFDAEHPCAMCCKIAKAKQHDEQKNPLPLEKTEKISKWVTVHVEAVVPAPEFDFKAFSTQFAEPIMSASMRSAKPPLPPPRALV